MSFSSDVKSELTQLRLQGRAEYFALLMGLSKVSASLVIPNGFRMETESEQIARLSFNLIKKLYKIVPTIDKIESKSFFTRHIYEINIKNANPLIKEIYGGGLRELYEDEVLFRVFVRGVFLGSGSLTSPDRSYHLELAILDSEFAYQLKENLSRLFNLNIKVLQRKNHHILYLKESEKISDFLSLIGATVSLFKFEDTRIIKQMRNSVNRVVNCETANIEKTTKASQRHLEAIRMLKDSGRWGDLPDRLKEIAIIREENPYATLTELGGMLSPPLGKSGVNHRLEKIAELAFLDR